jgi:hypothetical protein
LVIFGPRQKRPAREILAFASLGPFPTFIGGPLLIGGGPVSANPGTSWHAIGTDGGGSDILFQNTSGQASIWEMNGNAIAGGGPVSPNPGASWHAIAV